MLTKDKVLKIIARELKLNVEKVKPQARFIQDLGISSMLLWEMVLVMEDEFNIQVSDSDLKKIQTIQSAIDYMESRLDKEVPD
jgi:acyl carrier protein